MPREERDVGEICIRVLQTFSCVATGALLEAPAAVTTGLGTTIGVTGCEVEGGKRGLTLRTGRSTGPQAKGPDWVAAAKVIAAAGVAFLVYTAGLATATD